MKQAKQSGTQGLLTIHVPHASLHIPEDVWPEFLVDRDAIEREVVTSADLYTDQIAYEAWPNAKIVEAIASRIVVDVERYEEDALEEMAKVGRGAFYTHDHRQERIRQDLLPPRRAELLARYYTPHWARLREAAAGATLIDLHTYPSEPWPIERYVDGGRPEIDIGFTPDLTPEGWVRSLTRHFSDAGFEVGHNTPYRGVIDAGATAAVMIEVRRDVVGVPGDDLKWRHLITTLQEMPLVPGSGEHCE
jgi:N-formylglutamate deformylase